MSPELHFHKRYTAKADIFSMGVMLYQVYFNENPWSHRPGPGEQQKKAQEILRTNIQGIPIGDILNSKRLQAKINQKVELFPEQTVLA